MDRNLQTIQKAFQNRIFHVPDYQRGYAWEKKHIEALLEDIEILGEESSHYVGTLVVHKKDNVSITTDDGDSLEKYDIVDGQQRLTTITMLLAVVAEQFDLLKNETRAGGIRKKYVYYTENQTNKPRLTLYGDTGEYYIGVVIKNKYDKPRTLTQQRIREAMNIFHDFFDKKFSDLKGEYLQWLEIFFNKIVNNLKLTEYVVSDATEVGVIFEVMNNRGKHLTDMEKIKNYLLYCANKIPSGGKELGDEINTTWAKVLTSLMSADSGNDWSENQIVRNIYLLAYDPDAKNWHGYDTIKDLFSLKKLDKQELLAAIRKFLDILLSVTVAYCEIKKFSFDLSKAEKNEKAECNSMMKRIDRIGNVAPFIPLILALRNKNVKASELLMILELIEKYAFRVFKLAGKRSNTGQSTFFRLANDFFYEKRSFSHVPEQIKELLKWHSPHDEFVVQIKKRGNWYKKSEIKYILYEYEISLLKGKILDYSWDIFDKEDKSKTIDHILPQNPKDSDTKNWNEDEIRNVTHDLGNLVITRDNSSYSI